ncbi:MAG TPA: hypothetical protein VH092_31260 [Urbifossiella sp.]|nr:hypothetical protein [Urbifossiella sp.]
MAVGGRLAVDAGDALRLYDDATGKLLGEWSGPPFDQYREFICTDLSMDAAGRRVAFGNESPLGWKEAEGGRAWVVTFGRVPEVKEFPVLQRAGVWAVLSADGQTLVTGGTQPRTIPGVVDDSPRVLQVWDVETGKERRQIRAPGTWSHGAVLFPDRRRILLLGKYEVWDYESGKRVCALRNVPLTSRPDAEGWRVSADGREVYGITWEGVVGAWNAESGEQVRDYAPPPPRFPRNYRSRVMRSAWVPIARDGSWG